MLAPALAPHEAERRRLAVWATSVVLITGLIGLAVGAALAIHLRTPAPFWICAVLPTTIAGHFAWKRLRRFRTDCKAEALTALSRAIGLDYQCEGFEPFGVERLQRLDLLPSYERSHFEDRFAGRRDGVDFALYEARLEVQRGSGKSRRWVVVFGGQVLRIGFPKRFLGTTVVNRDSVHGWRREGFERIGLESSQFERIFEVYGTDQVEARYLVHPAFMERLMALETALGGEKLRCAFDEGELMVLVEGGDLFEIVNVFEPLPDRETTRKGVEGVSHVLKLIDAVLAPPTNPFADTEAAS